MESGSPIAALAEGPNPSPIRLNTSPSMLATTEIEYLNHLTQPGRFLGPPIRRSRSSSNIDLYLDTQSMREEENVAVRHLLESWMDRLQLISVLAIFFASLEATLLSITMPQDQGNPNLSATLQAANVCLTSGLLLHVLAAFVSFLGGFFLIRYRIKWAKVEQKTLIRARKMQRSLSSYNGTDENLYQSPITAERSESSIPIPMPVPQATGWEQLPSASRSNGTTPVGRTEAPRNRRPQPIWFLTEYYPTLLTSYNTPTADLCPRSGHPSMRLPLPTKLLSRFHFLCIVLTLLGFLFSLTAIVLNAWERLPHIVGVVCTVITAGTLLTILWMMFLPDRDTDEDDSLTS